MTDKQIEQAAENIAQNLYDYAKQGREPEYNRYDEGYLDAIDVQGSFLAKEGIEWALSNQWILVNDELPKDDMCVLAMYDDGGIIVAKYEHGDWWWQDGFVTGRNTKGDLMYSSSCVVPKGLITHWMPIPKMKEE